MIKFTDRFLVRVEGEAADIVELAVCCDYRTGPKWMQEIWYFGVSFVVRFADQNLGIRERAQ